jgi:methionine biosynthesis protein MetW
MNAPSASKTQAIATEPRVDLELIASMISEGAKVLDVGCSNGALLEMLEEQKGVDGRGIELSQSGVEESVARGLAVVQGDADTDLINYPDDSFDFVILSQTLQATRNPHAVMKDMLRIGHRAIISFPNFGHWRIRMHLLLRGEMPVTEKLPYRWYDTPNIHFCTIRDFVALCDELDTTIERAVALNGMGKPLSVNAPRRFWNLFGEQAVFLLRRDR